MHDDEPVTPVSRILWTRTRHWLIATALCGVVVLFNDRSIWLAIGFGIAFPLLLTLTVVVACMSADELHWTNEAVLQSVAVMITLSMGYALIVDIDWWKPTVWFIALFFIANVLAIGIGWCWTHFDPADSV